MKRLQWLFYLIVDTPGMILEEIRDLCREIKEGS